MDFDEPQHMEVSSTELTSECEDFCPGMVKVVRSQIEDF